MSSPFPTFRPYSPVDMDWAAKTSSGPWILPLTVFNNKIYTVDTNSTNDAGILYEWNGTDAWVAKTSGVVDQGNYVLYVFNNKLYTSAYVNSLYEWNGTDAWVAKVVGITEGENPIFIWSLIAFNSKLYCVGTGALYEWNGTDAWTLKAPLPEGESICTQLTVFNSKLYCIGALAGNLYEWNGTDAWVSKGAVAITPILALCIFNGKLYTGCTSLLEWNGTDAFVSKSQTLPNETNIIGSIQVFNNKLYVGTDTGPYTTESTYLYEWNGTDTLVEKTSNYPAMQAITALTVFNDELYCLNTGIVWGTYDGILYKYQ